MNESRPTETVEPIRDPQGRGRHPRVQGAPRRGPGTTLDARVRWTTPLGRAPSATFLSPVRLEIFANADNVLNNQATLFVEEGHNPPSFAYGDTRAVLLPPRYELGAQLAF